MKDTVTPFLWFDADAEAAAKFYVSIFPRSKITHVSSMTVSFVLDGRPYVAMNGGPHFKLSPAFSLYVSCASQAEVNRLWRKLLTGGGKESRCGWLVDRFGLSWQIVPTRLIELLSDADRERAGRARMAMLQMAKIDIKALERAANGK